jgi:hypothetical protein
LQERCKPRVLAAIVGGGEYGDRSTAGSLRRSCLEPARAGVLSQPDHAATESDRATMIDERRARRRAFM